MDRMEELPSCLRELMVTGTCSLQGNILIDRPSGRQSSLSILERIIATCPPVVESLLLQLPTSALLSLYHTSRCLRLFLQSYPVAWKYLSFRLYNTGANAVGQTPSGSELSGESSTQRSKPYALDQLLIAVVVPYGSRLCNLDLDNTAVSGYTLTSTILPSQRNTLQHLSVRGCKNVSLKYHIVPYLTVFSLQRAVNSINPSFFVDHLALKSIYTFRCRHHRRRPYFPGSLLRRDSDAEPTHELIKICYNLGIWTDTAWCPTPGGRCLRRKEYYTGRGNSDGRGQVWVVYDRLWRSSNKLGRYGDRATRHEGLMWEEAEYGHEGEPLGDGLRSGQGEGKTVPAHLRRSHKVFVEGFSCDDCGAPITERCEICSVRMHCMGCRKTLCASCAFSRPLPPKKMKTVDEISHSSLSVDHGDRDEFWWAPGETRNPNIMQEPNQGNHIQANQANPSSSPKLKLQWCCLQPTYSGAGGIAFVSAGMDADRSSRIRTAPLPRGKGWEDSEFARLRQDDDSFPKAAYGRVEAPDYTLKNGHDQVLHWLLYGPGNSDEPGCPRNLCQECYETKGWQAACQACRVPFCFQHDFRGLKMRICGYRDLHVEKAQLQEKENILAKEALVEEALAKRTQAEQSGYHSPVIQRIRELLVETSNPEDSTMQQVASLTPLPNTHDLLDVRDSTDDQAYDTDTSDNSTSQLDYLIKCDQEAHAKVKQCEPQWHGCASFLCPEYRSVGDHRPKCTAVAKICTVCSVHVCPECLVKSPPCDCSFCVAQYRCPNCFVKTRGSVCRKADEDRQAREKAKLQELRKALYKLSKERADNVAGQAGEFFARVEATPNERCHEVAEQIGESSSRLEASHEDIADSAAEQVGEFFAAVEGWNLG